MTQTINNKTNENVYVSRRIEKKNETFRLKRRVMNKINKLNRFCDKEKKQCLNEEE